MMTIALIDKFPILRKGLSWHLQENFEEVNVLSSESIDHFYRQFPDQKPDLTILGINQHPGTRDTDCVRIWKNRNPDGKIIIYDEKPDPDMVAYYLRANINGYISKQNTIAELNECIRTVLSGKRYVCPEVSDSAYNEDVLGESKGNTGDISE